MPDHPQHRKINPLAIIAIILILLALGMLFLIFAPGPRMKWALTMGEKYLTDCEYTQAVTMFSRAIRVDDRSEPAYLGRAEAYIQLNQPAAAVDDLTFVIDELTTDDADVYIQRAEAYTMQGNTEAARADLDTAASFGADTTAAEETLAALTPEPTPEPEKAFSLPVRYQSFLDADNPQTDIVATYYDNGKMRSTTSQGLTINQSRQFDENGYQVYSTSELGDLTTTYQFDENGKIVRSDSISTSTLFGGSSKTITSTYTYDDHGNKTSYNTTQNSSIDEEVRWVYEYDDEGRITHETSYTQSGAVYNDWTYVYAAEYQTGANVLLKTSARGREDTFLCKFGIGVSIVTIIFALTYAPYFYNILSAYGTRGINAPACSIEALSNFDISIKTQKICYLQYI